MEKVCGQGLIEQGCAFFANFRREGVWILFGERQGYIMTGFLARPSLRFLCMGARMGFLLGFGTGIGILTSFGSGFFGESGSL